ncbi:hypothetical protein [Flavobacterium sp. 3HN19-14]|uniref:hypothetical protein n=1 Tax=Flavobacterium sp. 3HN19-14 TaxID=3448133 RepID=UPI003EE1AC99
MHGHSQQAGHKLPEEQPDSITVTVGSGSGNITVTPSNGCGTGTARTLAVTPTALATQPSAVSGATGPCIGASVIYSVTNVAGMTYNWTLPSGWIKTAGGTTNSITVTVGSTSGTISVTATNSCNTSSAQTLSVSPLARTSTTKYHYRKHICMPGNFAKL